MATLVDRIYARFWKDVPHPYRILRERLRHLAGPGMTIVDAGCGYEAPNLAELKGKGATLIGLDLVDFRSTDPELDLRKADIGRLPLPDASVDLLYSRSVMEHVVDPAAVYAEAARVLKDGGRWIFLTANRWDYVSIVSRLTPNRFHGHIIHATEGREELDVFPTAYKTNSRSQILAHLARQPLRLDRLDYLGQYPAIFTFNAPLYLLATAYEKLIMRFDALRKVRGWLFVEIVRKPRSRQEGPR